MSNEPLPANYSSWAVGWTGFAGVMLIVIGVMDVIQGLVALFSGDDSEAGGCGSDVLF